MSQAPSTIALLQSSRPVADRRSTAAPVPPPPVAPAELPLRLIIEQAGAGFVYKFLDHSTGEVVKQYPREELVRLAEAPNYSPGGVIDARA